MELRMLIPEYNQEKIDVLVPSCKMLDRLEPLFRILTETATSSRVILSMNTVFSAAQNRNLCLEASCADYVIMVDDDMEGFYRGWDAGLISELENDASVSIVSARLMRPEGPPAAMMSSRRLVHSIFEEVEKAPTACVAFRKTPVRFDINFKGSGFEDDAFCLEMGPRIVIDNRVRLIHRNEMKAQSIHWEHNKAYFERTYGHRVKGAV